MASKKEKFLMYKGKPLLRQGNTIYYGDASEPYIAMMQISAAEPFEDVSVPTKIAVQIVSTDESLPVLERIKRNTEKKSFYDAIKIASIWLERILENADAELED